VDDLQLVLEESKTTYDAACHPSKYVFGHTGALKFIQRTGVHEFHAVVDARLDEEGSVEFDNFWSDRAMEDVQLHYDGVQLGLVELETYFLAGRVLGCARNRTKHTHFHRHGYIRRFVQNTFDHTVSSFTKVLEQLQLLHVDGV
jgi:hypothetical protein